MSEGEPYLVGRGRADITGEPAGVGMMGYGMAYQRTSGILQRQFSRAFIIADRASDARIVYVVADIGMFFHNIRAAILDRLSARFGRRYPAEFVVLTATHTHAGPGGASCYRMYNMTTGGLRPATIAALVDGVVESIERAHDDLSPGRLWLARGELHSASINRSPVSFAANPQRDRDVFPDQIDPSSTLLRLERHGRVVAAIHWFATHGTSLSNHNTLISGDNKGYAAYDCERSSDPGVVIAFAQSNAGDMSPNLDHTPGRGPTDDEYANCRIIGERQASAARELLAAKGTELTGGVDARLSYVDFSRVRVGPDFTGDGRCHHTSRGILGAAFAAGTAEGPGPAAFRQGVDANPAVFAVSRAVYRTWPALADAQRPKALLLPLGGLGWTGKVLPVQLVRIGAYYLAACAHEPTIVAGLRLRRTVAQVLGVPLTAVLAQGYANDYAGYITTPEEYTQQRYEGGHTMFGRWQLPAYQQEFARVAADLRAGRPSDAGPRPRGGRQWSARAAGADVAPTGCAFGPVLTGPRDAYRGGEQVRVRFVGANPNHDLHQGGSYLWVQRRERDGWVAVADDNDWSTRFHWRPDGAGCIVTITWEIPADVEPGDYRVVYTGDTRDRSGAVAAFRGTTPEFLVR
ncbi:MAG: neutral/alkaline non-lysosomal ceramidase N-terminal domain-containing protein [Mycobacteriaceae bacterium]